MEERKKSKRKVRKEGRKENLGSKSLRNVSIYQRIYRVSHALFILTLKAARNSPTPWSRVLIE
jgi:hypothetical protein